MTKSGERKKLTINEQNMNNMMVTEGLQQNMEHEFSSMCKMTKMTKTSVLGITEYHRGEY
jgi:hypothetical protein